MDEIQSTTNININININQPHSNIHSINHNINNINHIINQDSRNNQNQIYTEQINNLEDPEVLR